MFRFIAVTLAFMAVFAAPPTARAGEKEGWKAYTGNDLETAVREFTPLAEKGNIRLQWALGMIHARKMRPPEYRVAAQWFDLAARQGHRMAQYEMGLLFKNGLGVKSNAAFAVRYFNMAAAQNHALSQLELSQIYTEGRGVLPDRRAAAGWREKAIASNNAEVQFLLGQQARLHGQNAEAVDWYLKSARQGHSGAREMLGLLYAMRQAKPVSLDEALPLVAYWAEPRGFAGNVPRTAKAAAKWIKEIAESGHAGAQFELGRIFSYGYAYDYGLLRRREAMVEWWRRAADQGYVEAQFQLGYHLRADYPYRHQRADGVDLIRKAAEKGNAKALIAIENLCESAEPAHLEIARCSQYLKRAKELGQHTPDVALGEIYIKSRVKSVSEKVFLEELKKKASGGSRDAMFDLGMLHYWGWGVKRDLVEAYKWVRLSFDNFRWDALDFALPAVERKMTFAQIQESKRRVQEWTILFEANG